MRARRFALLLLGLVGSVLVAAVLYVSVDGALPQTELLPTDTGHMVTLPYPVPDTDLIVQRISYYEGPFLEDGTDREVVDIPALHLHNGSDFEVLRTCITLKISDTVYVFYGEHLPPGETTVLLEKDAKCYTKGDITSCTGWQERVEGPILQGVEITEVDMGTLSITNSTEETLHNLCLYYKSWLSPPGVYVGGITYRAEITVLFPGQTALLQPYHYAAGYTKVISVTADG